MKAMVLGTLMGLSVVEVVMRLPARRPSGTSHRSLTPRGRRAVLLAPLVLLGLVSLALVPLALLGWWTARRTLAHRAARARARAVRDALPDLVDLLLLATSAGFSLAVAHPLVARHTSAPVGDALRAAHEAAAAGRPRAEALVAALAPLGETARSLAQVLVDHLRYGVPLVPGLERTGLELRLDRRRHAELDARRVPVRLLAPLVTCVLPAFVLLTVVPLLAASLDALPT